MLAGLRTCFWANGGSEEEDEEEEKQSNGDLAKVTVAEVCAAFTSALKVAATVVWNGSK